MDNNRIRRLPPNIGNLKRLVHVDMNNNLLSSLNPEIGEWSQLQELSVSGNELESIPSTIGQLRSLVSLKLDENQLQELPESISQCEMLEELMLSHNDLSDLPASIGRLRRLRILTVDENFLRTLPNELSSCTSLAILSVRGNQLSELPPDIGHLVNLRVINIVNNFVTHLPVSLLNLQSLSALWINDNQSKPLVQLQKEYGPGGNIQLTCYMLPQTPAGTAKQQPPTGEGWRWKYFCEEKFNENLFLLASLNTATTNGGREKKIGAEKRRICFASEVNGNSQDDESDNEAAKEEDNDDHDDRTIEEKNGEREDLISASPAIQIGEPAAVRLMRSPTPYPKDLKMLAKYVRHAGTAGNRSSRGSIDESSSPQRVSMPPAAVMVQEQQQQQPGVSVEYQMVDKEQQQQHLPPLEVDATDTGQKKKNLYTSNYESELVVMSSAVATPPVVKEARVTSSIGQYSMRPIEETLLVQQRISMESQQYVLPSAATGAGDWRAGISNSQQQHQDVVNNNNNNNSKNLQQRGEALAAMPTPLQPPPYHIAKTYTKKSPEDLMIYDSFRNLKNQNRELFEGTNMSPSTGVQRALITPTPSISSVTTTAPMVVGGEGFNGGGVVDENWNDLPLPPPPPLTDLQESYPTKEGDGAEMNGIHSITETATTTMIPSVDDIDSLSILSKESSNTSPTKSVSSSTGGGVKKSESGHSWIFGLHRNPRVLQYQIHYSNSNELGFSVAQLPNEVRRRRSIIYSAGE